MQPTLVVLDDNKESFWALGVEQKGVTEGIVKYVLASWISQDTKARR